MNEDLRNLPVEVRKDIALGNLLSLVEDERFLSISEDEKLQVVNQILEGCGLTINDLPTSPNNL